MLVRTTKKKIDLLLKKNFFKWKILDIGCGYTASKFATHIADIIDFSTFYKDKKFYQIKKNQKLPFKKKEFDFVIASHVIEHVDNVKFFTKELMRVAKSGYIELPTLLEDNLINVNKFNHKWWFLFDDELGFLRYARKIQLFEPIMSVNMRKEFINNFRESLVTELYWKNKFNVVFDKGLNKNKIKISLLKFLKKFISLKLRNLFK